MTANNWNVVSYVRVDSDGTNPDIREMKDFDAHRFLRDAMIRDCPSVPDGDIVPGNKCVLPHWWLTSVQAGFEVWAEGIGAQAAVCGGGRYDGLAELLGGPPTPGVGFAAGLERAVMVMKVQGVPVPPIPDPPVFIVFLGKAARKEAVQQLVAVRQAGIGAQIAMSGSLRSQLRQADKRGARLAIIIGENELARNEVTLRDLINSEQEAVSLDAVIPTLKQRLDALP